MITLEEKFQSNDLNSKLTKTKNQKNKTKKKTLGKHKEHKSRASWRKEIINRKAEINGTENRKINQIKNWFFVKINKIDNLPGQTKDEKRRAKLPVSAIWEGTSLQIHPTELTSIIKLWATLWQQTRQNGQGERDAGKREEDAPVLVQ